MAETAKTPLQKPSTTVSGSISPNPAGPITARPSAAKAEPTQPATTQLRSDPKPRPVARIPTVSIP